MSIRLLSTKAVIIELSPIQDEKHELEEGFSFDFNPVLDKENNKRFLVVFFYVFTTYSSIFPEKTKNF